jgi:c-di-GMP-binding flagellar brake protein YcgR
MSPLLEVGQPVLVSGAADDPPRRMTVDLIQDDRITLAVYGNRPLPNEWRQLPEVHLTCLGRSSVYVIHVPVVRSGETRLVIGPPESDGAVQRRAYARVLQPVPVSCTRLDPEADRWISFDADVRDLGGGGCSVLSEVIPPDGALVAIAFSIDGDAPFVVVGRVLPREALPTIGKPLTRIEFVLIREADRDRVIGFVLQSLASRRRADRDLG